MIATQDTAMPFPYRKIMDSEEDTAMPFPYRN